MFFIAQVVVSEFLVDPMSSFPPGHAPNLEFFLAGGAGGKNKSWHIYAKFKDDLWWLLTSGILEFWFKINFVATRSPKKGKVVYWWSQWLPTKVAVIPNHRFGQSVVPKSSRKCPVGSTGKPSWNSALHHTATSWQWFFAQGSCGSI